MKKLLIAVILLFVAASVNANPFQDVTDYTVNFTFNCGSTDPIVRKIIEEYEEQPALLGISTAVKDNPAIVVLINPNTGDYTIILGNGYDTCIIDYGMFEEQ